MHGWMVSVKVEVLVVQGDDWKSHRIGESKTRVSSMQRL